MASSSTSGYVSVCLLRFMNGGDIDTESARYTNLYNVAFKFQ